MIWFRDDCVFVYASVYCQRRFARGPQNLSRANAEGRKWGNADEPQGGDPRSGQPPLERRSLVRVGGLLDVHNHNEISVQAFTHRGTDPFFVMIRARERNACGSNSMHRGQNLRRLENKHKPDDEEAERSKRQQKGKKEAPHQTKFVPGRGAQIQKQNDTESIGRRSKLELPAAQVGEDELEGIAKISQAGEHVNCLKRAKMTQNCSPA